MSHFYDRQGKPLSLYEWAAKYEHMDYKRVVQTTLPDGKWVSTVWLGLDHQFGDGAPLIFETMVFPSDDDGHDLDCERYSTEAEARMGHEVMVKKWGGLGQEGE